MAAEALGLPPPYLSTEKLAFKRCDPAKLFRISSHGTGEPYFGRSGANRFDAPGSAAGAAEFSACYLGFSLTVAIAESVLHDEVPLDGGYGIAQTTLDGKYVWRFQGSALRLANLTGAPLKRLGGHADLGGTCDYATTQHWSLAVHRNPGRFDGFVYMSRHLNTEMAVILFDRTGPKIQMATATKLLADPGFAAAAETLGIVGI
ncbi:hypothetical protein ACFDR9_000805 [Janthinobacterium sp. CG_23.3]|uniref:RES family NAD+ phosphorylase n=1 Tax=Janthinobacterium sp. CG_23.3 TaxID=3349634 RepID=UPI0038D5119C